MKTTIKVHRINRGISIEDAAEALGITVEELRKCKQKLPFRHKKRHFVQIERRDKMLKTCSVCGKIHDFNKVCRRKTTKKSTEASKFRKTYRWTEKSKYIKQRDNYLCQVCLLDKYNTNYKYTYRELEVHHIIPLEEDYNKRLDSDNLITLCRYHHELAEKGEISREELQEIIADK